MKLFAAPALCLCLLLMAACADTAPTEPGVSITDANTTVQAKVEGMDCTGCSGGICAALKEVDGVADAHADHATGELVVALKDDADAEAAAKEIETVVAGLSKGKYTISGVEVVTKDEAEEEEAPAEGDTQSDAGDADAVFAISGMTCEACSGKLTTALTGLDCVEGAYVCHKSGKAILTAAEGHDKVCPKMVAKAVEEAGFKVVETECEDGECEKGGENVYHINGMAGTECSTKLTEALTGLECVGSASVCHKSGTATLTAAEGHDKVCPMKVAEAVKAAGFEVAEQKEAKEGDSHSDAGDADAVYTISGMTCEACSTKLTEALTSIDCVGSASVCHKSGKAMLTTAEGHPYVCPGKVAAAVKEAGFEIAE